MKRRQLLLGTTGLLTTLAGCNTITDDNPENDRTTNSPTTNSTDSPNISVSISTETQPSQLPSIWTDSQNIEDFQAEFSVETSGQPNKVSISNGEIQINQESSQWKENSITVQPGQMKNGEQQFTATATKNGETAEDTTKASKPTPGNYKLDLVAERNEELRSTIESESDEENYLEARGGFIEDDPVLNTYSSHEAFSFDKLGVDLAAMEWYHDNDYEFLERNEMEESRDLVNSIGSSGAAQDVKNNAVQARYPNSSGGSDPGSWNYEKFSSATTGGEALDWLHPYLFNWNYMRTPDGPISDEDYVYAPVFEQAIEEHTDLRAHAWDFDLDEHGNGLIYTENADGSDELRIMETITKPVTNQLHPLVEDSNYLNPEFHSFNRYWHPLRFGWEEYSESQRWSFEEEKIRASQAVVNMASTPNLSRDSGFHWNDSRNFAFSTGYLKEFTEKLRTYNQNSVDFESLYNQAKVATEIISMNDNDDRNFVIYGDVENPQYAVVEDSSIIEDIWNDSEGQYDDFDQFLESNPSYSMNDVSADLEPQSQIGA